MPSDLINILVPENAIFARQSFFRESFATPSPPFCLQRGAVAAAADMPAIAVALSHLRCQPCSGVAVAITLAHAGDARNLGTSSVHGLHGLSPLFRGSFAKLAPNFIAHPFFWLAPFPAQAGNQECKYWRCTGGLQICSASMPPRTQRGIFRGKQ